ncbi:MAG: hypothetical protein F4X92_01995 [Gammaproteobacteria bacterium]|nr:hypothetical protein [Gammaproteobacteria bacterium]
MWDFSSLENRAEPGHENGVISHPPEGEKRPPGDGIPGNRGLPCEGARQQTLKVSPADLPGFQDPLPGMADHLPGHRVEAAAEGAGPLCVPFQGQRQPHQAEQAAAMAWC